MRRTCPKEKSSEHSISQSDIISNTQSWLSVWELSFGIPRCSKSLFRSDVRQSPNPLFCLSQILIDTIGRLILSQRSPEQKFKTVGRSHPVAIRQRIPSDTARHLSISTQSSLDPARCYWAGSDTSEIDLTLPSLLDAAGSRRWTLERGRLLGPSEPGDDTGQVE